MKDKLPKPADSQDDAVVDSTQFESKQVFDGERREAVGGDVVDGEEIGGVAGDELKMVLAQLCEADGQVLDELIGGDLEVDAGVADARALGGDLSDDERDARRIKLKRVLALLDAGEACAQQAGQYDPPNDLVTRTVAKIEAQKAEVEAQRRRFAEQVQMLSGPSRGLGVSWRQVLSAAAVFLLAVSLILPLLDHQQHQQQQALCEANLMSSFGAIQNHAQAHNGLLPQDNARPGNEWLSIGLDPSRSNTAQLFVLVREDGLSVDKLACPSNRFVSEDDMLVLGQPGFVDFQKPSQISYSYANQFTPVKLHMDALGETPILSDKNPLFVAQNGRMVFDETVPFDAPSVAHSGRGHNVLRANGVVNWSESPQMQTGGQTDNIWTVRGEQNYDGDEVPVTMQDVFLSP